MIKEKHKRSRLAGTYLDIFKDNRSTEQLMMLLPSDPVQRKNLPIATGVIDYFPLALTEVAKCSKQGNDQHNPGQPLHWDKAKSTDHADCLLRHFIDRGKIDLTGIRESARMAWRALALLQIELEQLSDKKLPHDLAIADKNESI